MTLMVAGLLALSDERDQWVRLALAWARSAYRSGYQCGHDAGYRTGYELAVREWKVVAGVASGGRPFAELDRLRYPPGGRMGWIISPACPPAARMTPYKLFRHLGIPAGAGCHQPPAGWREMDAGALAILHDLLHESGDGITIAHTHARPGDDTGRQHG
jgi:hypothetical protein